MRHRPLTRNQRFFVTELHVHVYSKILLDVKLVMVHVSNILEKLFRLTWRHF